MRRCPGCGKQYRWWRLSCPHGIYNVWLEPKPNWIGALVRVGRWLSGEKVK
jgi:hypothetical protein